MKLSTDTFVFMVELFFYLCDYVLLLDFILLIYLSQVIGTELTDSVKISGSYL